MNYQTCSDVHTGAKADQLEYKFVFPDSDNGIEKDANVNNLGQVDSQNLLNCNLRSLKVFYFPIASPSISIRIL